MLNWGIRWVRFLKSVDTCRIATVDRDGYPHCVPVGYLYHKGIIYIPTVSSTKKARNIKRSPKCCIVVDVLNVDQGRGILIQGEATLAEGTDFGKIKALIEKVSQWRLDDWRTADNKPNSVILLTPVRAAAIGPV